MAQHTYTGTSPLAIPVGENVVSIKLPSVATDITSLDIPDTATLDVTDCDKDVQLSIKKKHSSKKVTHSATFVTYSDGTDMAFSLSSMTAGTSSAPSASITNAKTATEIVFGSGLTAIPNYAFYGCTGITSVTIPDSVTSIGNLAFNGCTGITSVTIPDGIVSIGKKAFFGCSNIASVTYKGTAYNDSKILEKTLDSNGVTVENYVFKNTSIYSGDNDDD